MRTVRRIALITLALVAPTACATYVVEGPTASIGAQLSVERFLQAANQRDVRAMGRIFGTEDGSALETGSTFGCAFKKIGSWFGGNSCVRKQDVEIRMDAIASILQHEDYRVTGERSVPGRNVPARRVTVTMTTVQGITVAEVPFVVVQNNDGRWLVEQVDLQRVMAARQ